MRRIVSFAFIASAILVCVFVSSLLGQSTFGSFVGTVQDPSHATVDKCVITLTNIGTSAERSVETDKDGAYVLVNVEPGTYRIVMRAPGFQALTANDLQLMARQTVRVDGSLVVVGQAQSVQVNATAEAPFRRTFPILPKLRVDVNWSICQWLSLRGRWGRQALYLR